MNEKTTAPKPYLSSRGLADLLNVSIWTIRSWQKQKRIPGALRAGRKLVYDRATIERDMRDKGQLLYPKAKQAEGVAL